jgi:hypothetical protein
MISAVSIPWIERRDAEVAVAELALNDDQRHPFTRQLDRVGVPELMRRDPSTHTRCAAVRRRSARAAALDHARTRVGPWTTRKQRTDG